jgi:radical SAM superfamily enzyme YgiQ (UPF0313 family)
MFRPPAEAGSVLIRVADGCPHNACAFCAMYRGVPYRALDPAAQIAAIDTASRAWPDARRVFLADGDALALPGLDFVLDRLRRAFPRLARVNCYASGQALAACSDEKLADLRAKGLHTLYLGLESGAEEVLQRMHKGCTAAAMLEGGQRALRAGLSLSVMILIGLGGRELSEIHARRTAQVLNLLQPSLLSCLRLVPVPGTPLARWIATNAFRQLSEEGAARELRTILAGLDLRQTVFRADHSSNILPLAGRLPRDQARLLDELDELLDCGVLDSAGPGPLPSLL